MKHEKVDRKYEKYEKEVDKCLDLTLRDLIADRLYAQQQRIKRTQNKSSSMRG